MKGPCAYGDGTEGARERVRGCFGGACGLRAKQSGCPLRESEASWAGNGKLNSFNTGCIGHRRAARAVGPAPAARRRRRRAPERPRVGPVRRGRGLVEEHGAAAVQRRADARVGPPPPGEGLRRVAEEGPGHARRRRRDDGVLHRADPPPQRRVLRERRALAVRARAVDARVERREAPADARERAAPGAAGLVGRRVAEDGRLARPPREVRARRVAPDDVAPRRRALVVLEEDVVDAVDLRQAVGVVEPVPLRRHVVAGLHAPRVGVALREAAPQRGAAE